ncbi:MAG: hypothetical protein MUF87_02145 [Anaerolineae bacterium]|jgi:GAF domain-containing protein|nr:hypothetical protein [Anaerolineae bacterium]
MLARLSEQVLNIKQYPTQLARSEARMVYGVMVVILVLYTFYGLSVPQWYTPSGFLPLLTAVLQYGQLDPLVTFMFGSIYFCAVLIVGAVRFGYLNIGKLTLLVMWYVSGVSLQIYASPLLQSSTNSLLLFILMASLLYQQRGLVISTALSLLTVVIAYLLKEPFLLSVENAETVIAMLNQLFGGVLMIWLFLRLFRVSLSQEIGEAIDEREQLNLILSEVSKQVVQRRSLREVMQSLAQQITSQFDFVQRTRIYLLNGNRLEVDILGDSGLSILGQVYPSTIKLNAISGALADALLNGRETIQNSENIRDRTATEAFFPLQIGDQILGTIELISERPQVFQADHIKRLFRVLADNTALNIDNLQQFERAESRLRENDMLVEQTRKTLRDVERLNQRLTGNVWAQYFQNLDDQLGLVVDYQTEQMIREANWTNALQSATQQNHLIQEVTQEAQVIAVPLRVRGQIIGAMEFELDPERTFTPEDFELIQDVGERFGLAAENTRLVEESQRVAQREAIVNQINARLQTTNSVDATLSEAARSLREALKAGRVVIHLGKPTATVAKTEDHESWE